MNFYYCQSKWEHAVIEAKNVPLAKDTFVEIINSNLEDNKKISASDVKAVIVNVYHKGSKTAEQGVHPTLLNVRRKLVLCPQCGCVHGIELPASQSG